MASLVKKLKTLRLFFLRRVISFSRNPFFQFIGLGMDMPMSQRQSSGASDASVSSYSKEDIKGECRIIEMTVMELRTSFGVYEEHRFSMEFDYGYETTQIKTAENATTWLKSHNCKLSEADHGVLCAIIANSNGAAYIHLDFDDDVVHVVVYFTPDLK